MPTHYLNHDYPAKTEPKRRFYPTQEPQTRPPIPSAPVPGKQSAHDTSFVLRADDASYLMHRHPILLQRLYDVADNHLSAYRTQDFIYDAYPDYLSLRLMRDRLLRENRVLTEEFLQSGCPIEWLNLLTDTVLSELLCRKRCPYRNPSGDANTTSVQSALRS